MYLEDNFADKGANSAERLRRASRALRFGYLDLILS